MSIKERILEYFDTVQIGEWGKQILAVIRAALPIVLITFFSDMIQPITAIFCRKLPFSQLLGLSLANSVIINYPTSIAFGISFAVEGLFAQIHGTGNSQYLIIMLQRAIVISGVLAVLVIASLVNVEAFFGILGQGKGTSELASQYLFVYLPNICVLLWTKILISFCCVQGQMMSVAIVLFLSLPLSWGLHELLCYHSQLGLLGSANAQVISSMVMAFALVAIVYYTCRNQNCELSLQFGLWENWDDFSGIMLCNILLITLDSWLFEILIIAIGTVGEIEMHTLITMTYLIMVVSCLGCGIGSTAAISVGKELGSGRPDRAQKSASVAGLLGVVIHLITLGTFVALSKQIARIFPNHQAVTVLTEDLVPYFGVYQLVRGMNFVWRGIMRSAGRQALCSFFLFIGNFFVSIPAGFAFIIATDYPLQGVWLALIGGTVVSDALMFGSIYFQFDWEELADEAKRHASEKWEKLDKASGDRSQWTEPNVTTGLLEQIEKKESRTLLVLKRGLLLWSAFALLVASLAFYSQGEDGKLFPKNSTVIFLHPDDT